MNEFFTGYKSIPPKLKRFCLFISVAALLITLLVSYSVASHQKLAGLAIWNTEEKVTMEGLLTTEPYPVLHRITEENTASTESVMLVAIGKHDAKPLASAHAGKLVSVSGYSISRGGWLMLELDSTDDIKLLPDQSGAITATAKLSTTALGSVTLTGEIMDSKCVLGVMKPGSGLVHKACAELCLLGGIPPMLVIKDQQNRKFGYLLTHSDGRSASTELAPMAAESVTVSGQLEQQGDMLYLRMTNVDVNRL